MLKKTIVFLVVVLFATFAIIKLAQRNDRTDSNKLHVTASFYPLYDFAKNIGGDKVQATNITPAGSEPHDYEPTPTQLVDAYKSDVFIYSGATLEVWSQKFLQDYKHTAVKASDGVNLQEGADEDGKFSADILDPHFWLDPTLAQKIVDNIATGLSKADPKDAKYFAANANAYKVKLVALDQEFKNGLAQCQTRTLVTSHAAFGYLAKRYNLNAVSIAGVSPDEEPSAAKLAELARLIKTQHINYVFFESLVSPKLADTLAQETGAKTAVFDPIEGLSNDDQQAGKDYISVQRQNLANLRTALACR